MYLTFNTLALNQPARKGSNVHALIVLPIEAMMSVFLFLLWHTLLLYVTVLPRMHLFLVLLSAATYATGRGQSCCYCIMIMLRYPNAYYATLMNTYQWWADQTTKIPQAQYLSHNLNFSSLIALLSQFRSLIVLLSQFLCFHLLCLPCWPSVLCFYYLFYNLESTHSGFSGCS